MNQTSKYKANNLVKLYFEILERLFCHNVQWRNSRNKLTSEEGLKTNWMVCLMYDLKSCEMPHNGQHLTVTDIQTKTAADALSLHKKGPCP